MIRPLAVLLGLGLAVAGVFGGIIGWGRVRDVRVPRIGVWRDVPRLCVSGVPGPDVNRAIAWWRSLGHQIEVGCDRWTISLDADPTVDDRASVDDLSETHGITVVHVDSGVVVAAEIRVMPRAGALVVAHELGHALGYRHPDAAPSGHMMHPHRPGWDSRGLEAK